MVFVRQPFSKVRIVDVTEARFLQGSREEMKANEIVTALGERMSRISICGTVTERYDNSEAGFSSLTVDDGTDAMRVKAFKESVGMLEGVKQGDIVAVIGRVKNYADENFLSPETIRKIDDPNMETLWKIERLEKVYERKKMVDDIKNAKSQMGDDEAMNYAKEKFGVDEETFRLIVETASGGEIDYKPLVLEVIEKNDDGSGVEIAKLLELSKLDENVFERTMDSLIAEGMIYEPKVGRIRKV
jgi:RPA family protein